MSRSYLEPRMVQVSQDGKPRRKRQVSPGLVSNPFVKKRNLEWRISPPPLRRRENHGHGGVEADGSDENEALGEERCRQDNGANDDGVTVSYDGTASEHGQIKNGPDREPQGRQRTASPSLHTAEPATTTPSTSALIESNKVHITDHLAYFTKLLSTRAFPTTPSSHHQLHIHPRLSVPLYAALYARSADSTHGAHFVVTQHDHPIAGPHYDLRLQAGPTSSCSWAIMYGLPGDPNARGRGGPAARPGAGALRNATETRVHCLWNHLVETAGLETGSLLIWDTGEYEVLPPRRARGRRRAGAGSGAAPVPDPDSDSGSEDEDEQAGVSAWDGMTQQQKLAVAFASRKIRLRLRGARLPLDYVVNLRLTRAEDIAGRERAARATENPPRRRRRPKAMQEEPLGEKKKKNGSRLQRDRETSSSGNEDEVEDQEAGEKEEAAARARDEESLSQMERELRELEDAEVRRTNAYPGATNDIGSVHQRRWYLSLDAEACGFVRTRRADGRVWWERKEQRSSPAVVDAAANVAQRNESNGTDDHDGQSRLEWPFYVLGPDHERSVVTGRLGADVLRDEGVVGYVGRKGWRPIKH